MSTLTLESTLADLRTKVIRAGAVRALLWSLAAAVIAVVAAAWVDLVVDLDGALRLACLVIAGVVMVIVGLRLFAKGTSDSKPAVIAQRLDSASDQHGQIVAGVDLHLRPTTTTGSIGAGLASIAIDRAATIVRRTPTDAIAPARDRKRPMYVLAGVVALVLLTLVIAPRLVKTQLIRFLDPFGDHPPYSNLVFSVDPGDTRVLFGASADVQANVQGGDAERVDLVLRDPAGKEEAVPMFPIAQGQWRASVANVTQPTQYFIRSGRARSERFDLDVITVPQIQKVSFTVTYPAYTNRPPYNGPLPQGGLSGLPGTKVKVTVASNRELKSGSIAYTPSGAGASDVAMTPAAANEAAGEFEITASGKIEIGVTDTAGQASTERFAAPVTVLRDDRPFVRLMSPQSSSYATPNAVIEIAALAEDDYGVSKVSVYRGLNDTRPRPMEFDVPTPAPTRLPAQQTLKIRDYGLKPGDVIKLFARVEDNDPAGAKGSESQIAYVQIISQDQMDLMTIAREGLEALEAKYAAAARQMESLAAKLKEASEELAKLDPKSELSAEQREKLEQIAKAAEQAASELAASAEQPLPLDLDKAFNEHVKEASAAMNAAAAEARDAGKPGQSASQAKQKVDDALKKLGQEREELKEQVEKPLEQFAAVYPLLEDQGRFMELASKQKDLAYRLQSMETQKGDDNPQLKSRMREMQDEQEQVRQQLQKLSDDIREHVTKLPDDPSVAKLRDTALEFVEQLDASAAKPEMQKAEAALQDFAGTRASVAARAAADELDKLISRCKSMGEEGEQCLAFNPSLSEAMANTAEQLLQAAGLGSKPGTGAGNGGGYSAQRSSLQNVGLYGATPKAGKQSSATGDGRADRGVGKDSKGQPDTNANPDGKGSAGKSDAAGENDAPVPAEYKGRVSDYFRRVADELEQ